MFRDFHQRAREARDKLSDYSDAFPVVFEKFLKSNYKVNDGIFLSSFWNPSRQRVVVELYEVGKRGDASD
jgi:hypothetical protein